MPGETPEGPWAVFAHPRLGLVSVLVPRSLWQAAGRADPFTSGERLLEAIGAAALARREAAGGDPGPVVAGPGDLPLPLPYDPAWEGVLRRCGHCGRPVPEGELAEALGNALSPDGQGEVTVAVYCPACRQETRHRLSPWGVRRG